MIEPRTDDEWREAMDAAVFSIALAAAQSYGLVTGPAVDVARCEDVLERGRAAGYPVRTLDQILEGSHA